MKEIKNIILNYCNKSVTVKTYIEKTANSDKTFTNNIKTILCIIVKQKRRNY